MIIIGISIATTALVVVALTLLVQNSLNILLKKKITNNILENFIISFTMLGASSALLRVFFGFEHGFVLSAIFGVMVCLLLFVNTKIEELNF